MNQDKRTLRKQIRETKRQFSDKELEELSLPIISRLLSHPVIVGSKTILM